MTCDVTKFVITKGVDNTFIFTIKQDGSTQPMVIEGGDTFVADLILLEDSTTTIEGKALTVESSAEGKVALTLTEAEVDTLVSDKGPKVDRYYLRPTYKMNIICSTTNNGDFIARVAEIYVD